MACGVWREEWAGWSEARGVRSEQRGRAERGERLLQHALAPSAALWPRPSDVSSARSSVAGGGGCVVLTRRKLVTAASL